MGGGILPEVPTISDSTTAAPAGASAGAGASAVRLTQQVKAGGCASKLPPGVLNNVLSRLPSQQDENLLVGFETADDAGVYRIGDDQALVQTVDFFTPMVDDAYTFGQVAATNALSDVYAMGGQALTALSIVCFPQNEEPALLEQIMRGGLSVMREAGCVVLGGHSVRDAEIKFGYAVTGMVDPRRVLKNCTAQPGDALVLAKAIGTGVITTALKQGRAQSAWVETAIASMTRSNRAASEIAAKFDVHSMTDVTGFGLMGHAREMALGSGVRLMIYANRLPLMNGAVDAAAAGCLPAGLHANREFAGCFVEDRRARADDVAGSLIYDPQTSGGLLIAVAAAQAEELTEELRCADYPAARIGEVVEGAPKIILKD